jgi:small conductance mechanosensitive channel
LKNLFTCEYWVKFGSTHAESALLAAARIAVIIIAYLIIRYLVRQVIGGLLNKSLARLSGDMLHAKKARLQALRSMLSSAVAFILAFLAAIMILQAAGINIVPLLTTASIAGLAIGFGAQKLVRDVISGFFILIEDQYGIGDYVTIGTIAGKVEDLQIRTTRIRDLSGRLYVLSNGDISQVCNHSRGELILSVDYTIPVAADISKARKALAEVGGSMARDFADDFKNPNVCDGLVQISSATNVIRFFAAVTPSAQDHLRFELNSRVRAAFDKHQIPLA